MSHKNTLRCNECWEVIQDGTAYITKCSHIFCLADAKKWFNSKDTCPACNTKLSWVFKLFLVWIAPVHPVSGSDLYFLVSCEWILRSGKDLQLAQLGNHSSMYERCVERLALHMTHATWYASALRGCSPEEGIYSRKAVCG